MDGKEKPARTEAYTGFAASGGSQDRQALDSANSDMSIVSYLRLLLTPFAM
jgi:hypothetical protein